MNERVNRLFDIKAVFLLLAVITALRVFYLSFEQFNLFFDEAQYWFWSKTPDWGYFSKPPMVAWLISLTTNICGDGEACVRLSSPFMHMITALAVYFLAEELFDKKIAFYSAISYATLPAVSVSSAVVSTDAALLTFWALSMLFFIKAMRSNRIRWWVLAGIAAGLGMMSKYNMSVGVFSALVYLTISKDHRQHLKSLRLWSAVVISALIFLPNVIWNFNNGLVSFLHTKENASGGGMSFNFTNMFEFIGAQFGVFGPIFFAALIFATICFFMGKGRQTDANKFLLIFIAPLFIVIVLVSLFSRAHANWAAPIYVPATIFVVAWLFDTQRTKLIKISIVLHIMVALLFTNFYLVKKIPGVELTGKRGDILSGKIKDPFKRLHGWKELGEGVSVLMEVYSDAAILTNSRKIHSELLYYVKPMPDNMVKWNPAGKTGDHFELTTDINKAGTKNFLLITKATDIDSIAFRFESATRVGNMSVSPYEDYPIDYYAYYLQGFGGYE